jgi:rRNA-processing protein Efg1
MQGSSAFVYSGNERARSDEKPRVDLMSRAVGKPLGWLKKQIRDLDRFLARDLPAEVAEAKRKDVEALRALLEKRQSKSEQGEVARKHQKRYRGVKFVEAKKVARRFLAADDDEERERFRAQLNYIGHYPYDKPYVSIIMEPTGEALEMRTAIYDDIVARLASRQLSDVSSRYAERELPKSKRTSKAPKKSSKKKKNHVIPDDESESDEESDDESDDEIDDNDQGDFFQTVATTSTRKRSQESTSKASKRQRR